jgi:hypothetical protein
VTPLRLGLIGLGFDRAKPKPFSLSCKSVTPCADRAGDDTDRVLACEGEAALASLKEARVAICLEAVAAKGVIPNIVSVVD